MMNARYLYVTVIETSTPISRDERLSEKIRSSVPYLFWRVHQLFDNYEHTNRSKLPEKENRVLQIRYTVDCTWQERWCARVMVIQSISDRQRHRNSMGMTAIWCDTETASGIRKCEIFALINQSNDVDHIFTGSNEKSKYMLSLCPTNFSISLLNH